MCAERNQSDVEYVRIRYEPSEANSREPASTYALHTQRYIHAGLTPPQDEVDRLNE
jgi:hypothetical protein